MNKFLQEINKRNLDSEILSQMWESYLRNSEFNLEATGEKKEPI